jgi:drug/metabolite transporter, DME family
MARDRDVLLGSAAALAGASLFGMLGVLTRFAADAGVGGAAFTAWRAILGVSFVGLLILVRGRTRSSVAALRTLSRGGRLALATACLTGVILNLSMFTAFGLIPIALALMLFYTYPAGVAVVDLALGRERMTGPRFAALALSFTGVALVLLGGSSVEASTGATLSVVGIVLALTAATSQVVFVTVSRSGYSSVPADAATLVAMAASIVGATVIALLVGQAAQLVAPLRSPDPWPYLLLAGVAAAGISSMLFLTAIRTIGGTRAGILMLFEPVVGTVLAALLLGEPLGAVQLLGGLLVLAGALVLQLRSEPGLDPVTEPSPTR